MPDAAPASFPSDPIVNAELARAHKLSADEYDRILKQLGRAPTYAELGVFSVMWSEHCSYKSSRVHLSRLPTQGPRVIQGPGENAGVVDIGDGYAAVFKMESHNHPSFIEPYQGAATGVGGILRDVFTMGARPIANLNSLRFGRPDHPRTPHLMRGVVAGIGGYGNCIGVPTVGGELFFDKAYDGNILVNAFTCGIARADRIFYGRASGVGNPVLYVGSKTGRDGIHGATMASDEFSSEGPKRRPTVQVGDPFMEKLLLEACLEIFAEDLLIGIQDMGAAGLTSSSVEMAGRSGSGLLLDLDLVPRRAKGLSPYEMLLSESQERMLMVAKPGAEARVLSICEKWGLDAAIIGRVTDSGRWVVQATPGFDPLSDTPVERNPVVVCDISVELLTDEAPKYDRKQMPDASLQMRKAFDTSLIPDPESWAAALLQMVGSPNLSSRRWVWTQYDHIVRGGTLVRPGGGDAAVVRVFCETGGTRPQAIWPARLSAPRAGELELQKRLAFASDCNGRLCELDPYWGAAMAVMEVCRNLICVGGEPVGITDCLNFGSPERPEIMWQFARAIDGMAAACKALSVPIVSGNVSLYNETDGRAVLPTPTVAAVGLIEDEGDILRAAFPRDGLCILLLGAQSGGPLGGSEYVALRTGEVKGTPPVPDLELECRLQRFVLGLCRARPRLIESAHDVSDGGLATALVECCTMVDDKNSMVGAAADVGGDEGIAAALFGEAPSRIVVSAVPGNVAALHALAEEAGVKCRRLGQTGGEWLKLTRGEAILLDVALSELWDARERTIPGMMGA